MSAPQTPQDGLDAWAACDRPGKCRQAVTDAVLRLLGRVRPDLDAGEAILEAEQTLSEAEADLVEAPTVEDELARRRRHRLGPMAGWATVAASGASLAVSVMARWTDYLGSWA